MNDLSIRKPDKKSEIKNFCHALSGCIIKYSYSHLIMINIKIDRISLINGYSLILKINLKYSVLIRYHLLEK